MYLEKCGSEKDIVKILSMLNISKEDQNNVFNGNFSRKILENYNNYINTLPINLKPLAEEFRLKNCV